MYTLVDTTNWYRFSKQKRNVANLQMNFPNVYCLIHNQSDHNAEQDSVVIQLLRH